jgi:predicted acyl esterase
MKKKSSSKLAFFNLRVLPGLVAAAFIAFALALSDSVGDTLSCPTPQTAYWPGAATPSPAPPPQLWTELYLTTPAPSKPVLVFRGCNAGHADWCAFWPDDAAYYVVGQEIRGDCLAGPFQGDLLYKFDRDDGHALLETIDAKSWSQGPGGHIAMEGWSNVGIMSYLAAVGAGTSLRGIRPHFATGDLLNYGLFNGGVWHEEIPWPVDLPAGTAWKDYVALGIWNKYLITDSDANLAKVAGLHIGGWFDVFGQGILDTFSRLQTAGGTGARNNQKIVIGPWGHGEGVVGQIPFPSASVTDAGLQANGPYDTAWKQCVFGLGPTPCAAWNNTNTLPAVKVYVMSPDPTPSGVWTTYTTWPPPAQEKTFYFTAGHGLSANHQVSGQLAFTSDPSDPCPTYGGTNNLTSCGEIRGTCGPYDQTQIEARQVTPGDVVVFTSGPDPLTGGGPIVGRMYADVWIKTNLLDVDVFVRMTDVYPAPDNRSMLMAQGIQRARYRNGGACPQLLVPDQATKIRVDLGSTALALKPGHKLRVIVSASAGHSLNSYLDPLYSVNPQNGDEYIGAHPKIKGSINVLVGGDRVNGYHESALVVPQATGQSTPPDHRPPKPTPCPIP